MHGMCHPPASRTTTTLFTNIPSTLSSSLSFFSLHHSLSSNHYLSSSLSSSFFQFLFLFYFQFLFFFSDSSPHLYPQKYRSPSLASQSKGPRSSRDLKVVGTSIHLFPLIPFFLINFYFASFETLERSSPHVTTITSPTFHHHPSSLLFPPLFHYHYHPHPPTINLTPPPPTSPPFHHHHSC